MNTPSDLGIKDNTETPTPKALDESPRLRLVGDSSEDGGDEATVMADAPAAGVQLAKDEPMKPVETAALTPEPKKKSKKGWIMAALGGLMVLGGGGVAAIVGIVVVLAFLVAAGGGVTWYLLSRSDDASVAELNPVVETVEVVESGSTANSDDTMAALAQEDEAGLDETTGSDDALTDDAITDGDGTGDEVTDSTGSDEAGTEEDTTEVVAPTDSRSSTSANAGTNQTASPNKAAGVSKTASSTKASSTPARSATSNTSSGSTSTSSTPARSSSSASSKSVGGTDSAGTATTKILSNPPTATVIIDGREMGRTPSKLELETGRHTVQVRSGDDQGTFTINVRSGGDNKWCFDFETNRSAPGACN